MVIYYYLKKLLFTIGAAVHKAGYCFGCVISVYVVHHCSNSGSRNRVDCVRGIQNTEEEKERRRP